MLNLLYRIRVFSSRLLCRPNNLSITLQQLGLRQSLTILDVGAHKGQTSAYFNKIFPDSILHAFEPSPILFKTLTQNLQNFQNTFTSKTHIHKHTIVSPPIVKQFCFVGCSIYKCSPRCSCSYAKSWVDCQWKEKKEIKKRS